MLIEVFVSENWTGLYRVIVFGIDRFEQSLKAMVTQRLLHFKSTQNFDVELFELNCEVIRGYQACLRM